MFDIAGTTPPPRRSPVGTAGRLREALAQLARGHARIVRQSERPWASITFEGARHTVEIVFEGLDGITAGEAFIEALPEHEFAIPGQLVAEASITEVDHRLAPAPRMAVTCEMLLLKDA